MLFLSEVIEGINGILKSRFSGYPRAEYCGVITQAVIIDNGVTLSYPSVIDAAGNVKAIAYNKKYPFIIYHRLATTTFGVSNQTRSYGDGDTVNRTSGTLVKLVCVGNRKDLNATAEDFAGLIADSFPTSVALSVGIKHFRISPTTITYDARQVFSAEFEKVPFFIGPDQFLFAIQYNVEGAYVQGCYGSCDC